MSMLKDQANLAAQQALRACHEYVIGHDGKRSIDAERRVIVERVIRLRPVIEHLVTLLGQLANQKVTQVEAGVVGGDVDAHASILPFAT